MAEQYIFTIENLTKAYGKREVLKNIWLAFYPGAKIGVIGSNGAGKSTLLRIMAGVDKDFLGTARLTAGFSIGYVPQEPRLDDDQGRARATSRRPSPPRAPCSQQQRGTRQQDGRGRRPTRSRSSSDEMDRVQDAIDAANAWDLDRQLEIAMDAMRLPPGDATADDALRRRAAPRRPVQDAAAEARPAAARRADQPPRRRVGRLAGTAPAGVPRHRRRRHARPLLPRQRGPVDPGAGPRPGHPVEGQLLRRWLEQKQAAAGQGGEAGVGPAARRWPASWSGRAWPRGPASPRARPASAAYEKLASPGVRGARGRAGPADPARAAPGRPRRAGRGRPQGLRRQPADGGPELRPAARRHRRRHRPQRRRQDDAVPHDRRPGEAGRRQAARRRDGACRPTSIRTATPSTTTRRSSRRSPAAPTTCMLGKQQGGLARLRRPVQLQGAGPAAQGRRAVRRRAQPRPPGQAAAQRRQPAAARRADQRPRRGHAAGAGGGAC